MELLGNLKDKVSKAKSKNEAKEIIESAGIRLTDAELDMVAGGLDVHAPTGHGRGEFDPQIDPSCTEGNTSRGPLIP